MNTGSRSLEGAATEGQDRPPLDSGGSPPAVSTQLHAAFSGCRLLLIPSERRAFIMRDTGKHRSQRIGRMEHCQVPIDGNEAAASVAYKTSEVIAYEAMACNRTLGER